MALEKGSKLGPYEIVAPLGAGGMGEVYRAKDSRLGREVAVKVLPESTAKDPEALARFEREAKTLAALSHPNLLALHDFGSENELVFAVMELLEGETLRQALKSGALPKRKWLAYGRQIADGLAAAHEKGVIHRDLKPENLFITKDDRVKILDFGLAKISATAPFGASDGASPTRSLGTEPGVVMGTVGYMAPEQVRGEPADPRSDLFALGAVLYEMATGCRAFSGETAAETLTAVLRADPPESADRLPAGSPAERIIRHCLEKKPGARFQSARDLAFDLEHMGGSSSTATLAVPGADRGRRVRLAAVGAAVMALAGAFWLGRRASGGASPGPLANHRITYERGNLLSARLSQDGETAYFSAAWDGAAPRLYAARVDGSETRALGIENADLLAVSPTGELAIKLLPGANANPEQSGRLATIPAGGGSPREIAEGVLAADWDPGGKAIAVARVDPEGTRIEYPPGHLILASPKRLDGLRISPDGTRIAYLEHVRNEHSVWVIPVAGGPATRVANPGLRAQVSGLAWASDARTLWISIIAPAGLHTLEEVGANGARRILHSELLPFYLHDRARNGRTLLESGSSRVDMTVIPEGGAERVLTWGDKSFPVALRDGGRTVLFLHWREQGVGHSFLRRDDAAAPIDLGAGYPVDLSPDGKWVLVNRESFRDAALIPTGVGEVRPIANAPEQIMGAKFLPAGDAVIFCGGPPGAAARLIRVPLSGGPATPLTEPGQLLCAFALSPDGKFAAVGSLDDARRGIYSLADGALRKLPNFTAQDQPMAWSDDGRELFVADASDNTIRIARLDIAGGRRTPVRRFDPPAAGFIRLSSIVVAPGGRAFAYGYHHSVLSELHAVDGLK